MIFRSPFTRTIRYRDGLPILPGALPIVGHIPALYKDAPGVYRRAMEELGPLFWVTSGPGTWLLAVNGTKALDLFRHKSFTSAHLAKIAPLVAGESLLGLDGAPHRHVRSAMNAPFLPSGLSASVVGPMMARCLEGLVAKWGDRGKARVLEDIQETALEVIFRMIGVDPGDLMPWRKKYRDLLLANLGIPLMFPGSPAYRAARAATWINDRFAEIIAAARRAPDPTTLVGALVQAKDDEGAPLTDTELIHNLRLLVLGGHETISATMGWIAIYLGARPDLWDALVEEAREHPRVPETPQEARSFHFAEALFREAVRMHPPFGSITRVASEQVEVYGKPIPEGTIVAISLWGPSHDAELYPDPEAFTPSRWIGRKSPPTAIEISQFGAGPHFCLGYHLAWLEAVQFAVALAQGMTRRGRRPRLVGNVPRPIYLPTERPPAKTVVDFV